MLMDNVNTTSQIPDLQTLFERRTQNISSIFSSYRTLYQIYMAALDTVKANENTIIALTKAKESVGREQSKISNQLYSQGFILLVASAEALLKDVFDRLLTENFTKINLSSSLNFSAKDIQKALSDWNPVNNQIRDLHTSLGRLVEKKMHDSKNPIEKINFQNVLSMRTIFKSYLDLEISDSETTRRIHKYWQQRHLLMHSNGIIDERYINNVKVVDLLTKNEVVGAEVIITKKDYDKAVGDFTLLFGELTKLILEAKLNLDIINATDQVDF
ncbi:MAG: hypothetical protein JWN38_266 [Candidatus Saccharibacteria bacterium]|nr:hypothetical protein [Candidatus Saccharibacteria bacterium]